VCMGSRHLCDVVLSAKVLSVNCNYFVHTV
jgi:hypothetical protein